MLPSVSGVPTTSCLPDDNPYSAESYAETGVFPQLRVPQFFIAISRRDHAHGGVNVRQRRPPAIIGTSLQMAFACLRTFPAGFDTVSPNEITGDKP